MGKFLGTFRIFIMVAVAVAGWVAPVRAGTGALMLAGGEFDLMILSQGGEFTLYDQGVPEFQSDEIDQETGMFPNPGMLPADEDRSRLGVGLMGGNLYSSDQIGGSEKAGVGGGAADAVLRTGDGSVAHALLETASGNGAWGIGSRNADAEMRVFTAEAGLSIPVFEAMHVGGDFLFARSDVDTCLESLSMERRCVTEKERAWQAVLGAGWELHPSLWLGVHAGLGRGKDEMQMAGKTRSTQPEPWYGGLGLQWGEAEDERQAVLTLGFVSAQGGIDDKIDAMQGDMKSRQWYVVGGWRQGITPDWRIGVLTKAARNRGLETTKSSPIFEETEKEETEAWALEATLGAAWRPFRWFEALAELSGAFFGEEETESASYGANRFESFSEWRDVGRSMVLGTRFFFDSGWWLMPSVYTDRLQQELTYRESESPEIAIESNHDTDWGVALSAEVASDTEEGGRWSLEAIVDYEVERNTTGEKERLTLLGLAGQWLF